MEENAVNAARAGAVDPREDLNTAGAAREAEPAEQREIKEKPARAQTPEVNASFAAMRRENERLSRELEEAKARSEKAAESGEALLSARREAGVLQALLSRQRFESDLAEIKRFFPEEKAGDVTELGEQFLRLRAAGIDNLTAYRACVAAGEKPAGKPETGAVGADGNTEKTYYSPSEVDRLTKRELSNPKILERVMRSMTKWR